MNTQFETKHKGGKAGTHVWFTPKYIIDELGPFDLDPCTSIFRPFDTAINHYTPEDNGLFQNWEGRVWCNPPYGSHASKWLSKLADHGNGIALIFARTETNSFFDNVWNQATALLFLKGRIRFCTQDGIQTKSNAGAPSVLIAYGENNADILKNCSLEGAFVRLR